MEAGRAARRAPWNVTPWTYRVIVSEYTLPEVPRPRRRYEVTVTLPRPAGVEALVPPGGQAAVDITAAAIAAEGLLTAWTCRQSVVSMIVDLPSMGAEARLPDSFHATRSSRSKIVHDLEPRYGIEP